MFTILYIGSNIDNSILTFLSVWLITIFIVFAGFRYAKKVIAFVMIKLYDFFIQHNILKL